MIVNPKDVLAGLLLTVLGLALGSNAYLTLDLGTSLRMGPGYFPMVLSGLLILIGMITAFKALGEAPSPIGGVPWRGLILILLAPIFFGATVRGLGFVPSVAIAIAISVLASRRITLLSALIITSALTLFCVAVFLFGLRLPVRPFGSWLLG